MEKIKLTGSETFEEAVYILAEKINEIIENLNQKDARYGDNS